MFARVVEGSARRRTRGSSREPFGRDLASARELDSILRAISARRRSTASIITSAGSRCRTSSTRVSPIASSSRSGTGPTCAACRSPGRGFGVRTGALLRGGRRDPRRDPEPSAPGPREPRDGSSHGGARCDPRRKGAAAQERSGRWRPRTSCGGSSGATGTSRASPRLRGGDLRRRPPDIDSWRWAGVPFYIRGGKCLPATSARSSSSSGARRATRSASTSRPCNHLRFRLSPEVVIAIGMRVKRAGERMAGENVELVATHRHAEEMTPYNACSATPCAETRRSSRARTRSRRNGRWSTVCSASGRLYAFAQGSWGPDEAQQLVGADGPWHDAAAPAAS